MLDSTNGIGSNFGKELVGWFSNNKMNALAAIGLVTSLIGLRHFYSLRNDPIYQKVAKQFKENNLPQEQEKEQLDKIGYFYEVFSSKAFSQPGLEDLTWDNLLQSGFARGFGRTEKKDINGPLKRIHAACKPVSKATSALLQKLKELKVEEKEVNEMILQLAKELAFSLNRVLLADTYNQLNKKKNNALKDVVEVASQVLTLSYESR